MSSENYDVKYPSMQACISCSRKSQSSCTMIYGKYLHYDVYGNTKLGFRHLQRPPTHRLPDSKVPGANMGPIWGRQDPGGPHVGPMNFAIWAVPFTAPTSVAGPKLDIAPTARLSNSLSRPHQDFEEDNRSSNSPSPSIQVWRGSIRQGQPSE